MKHIIRFEFFIGGLLSLIGTAIAQDQKEIELQLMPKKYQQVLTQKRTTQAHDIIFHVLIPDLTIEFSEMAARNDYEPQMRSYRLWPPSIGRKFVSFTLKAPGYKTFVKQFWPTEGALEQYEITQKQGSPPARDIEVSSIPVAPASSGRHLKATLWRQFNSLGMVNDISAEGRLFAIKDNSDQIIKVFDLEKGEEKNAISGSFSNLRQITISQDGNQLAGVSETGITLWNVISGQIIKQWPNIEKENISYTILNRDFSRLVNISGLMKELKLSLWDMISRKKIKQLDEYSGAPNCQFTLDGKYFAAIHSHYPGGTFRIWDATTGKIVNRYDPKSATYFKFLVLSPDSKFAAFVCGVEGYEILLANIQDEKAIKKLPGGARNGCFYKPTCLAFSPDSKRLAGVFAGNTIMIWDITRTEPTKTVEFSYVMSDSTVTYSKRKETRNNYDVLVDYRSVKRDSVALTSLSFSTDGQWLTVGTSKGKICIYDLTYKEEIASWKADSTNIQKLVFSTGNTFILSMQREEADVWKLEPGFQESPLVAYPSPKAQPQQVTSAPPLKPEPIASQPAAPKYPANLEASLAFSEPSGNNLLDAEEHGKVVLTLHNDGLGEARRLQIKLTPETEVTEITIDKPAIIDRLPAGGEKMVEIPVSAGLNVTEKSIRLKIEVAEAVGMDLDPPAYITFATKAFQPPKLEVVTYGIDDASGNGQIEPGEVVKITARIQNRGVGEAKSVKAVVSKGTNIYFAAETETTFELGSLSPGQFKDISFSVYATNKAMSVPISIKLSEIHSQYGSTQPLDLALHKPEKRATELVIAGKETTAPIIRDAGSLSVDVDLNIPTSRTRNPEAIAVIVGVERYANISPVTYAKRDASFFKEYAVKVLGVPDDKNHLYYKLDEEATKGALAIAFIGKSWLTYRVTPNTDLYVFYAGHGAPDSSFKNPYLIPHDGNVNYAEQTGLDLREIYSELEKLPARSITLFLDACFSGADREDKTLFADGRPGGIAVIDPVIQSDKLTVFSASSGTQISSGYRDMKHGLFTYFLLKGLRGEADANNDDAITIAELESYLTSNVSRQAGLLDREQTPQVWGKNKERILVQY